MFGMGLIFAFVVASQIHTGADLLAACQQSDTSACETLLATVDDCMTLRAPGETPRQIIIAFLKAHPEYTRKPADQAIFAALGSGCE